MPAVAKGELVQIGISGGDLRREIRIPANNADLSFEYTEPPAEIPRITPYAITFYMRLGSEIVAASPSSYFPGSRPLLHHPASGPHRDWSRVERRLARRLDRAIAAARTGRYRSAPPPDATITSWPLLVSWTVPSMLLVAVLARRAAVRSERRTVRAAPA